VQAVLLVVVSVALLVTLGFLLFGSRRGAISGQSAQQRLEAEIRGRASAETDLERRRKELDEQRAQLQDLRDQLKQTKRKLFDERESERENRSLSRAREESERSASVQLEAVRAELYAALTEIERIKREAEAGRSRRPPPPAEPAPPPPAAAAPEKPVRKLRELSDADRERMQRLEQQAARERSRSGDLDRELKRFRARLETQHRVYVVTKGELDLIKDKFKALEKRLNRTLLERDLIRRAIVDLEKRSGISADRTELTPEEIAASDRRVEETAAANPVSNVEKLAEAGQPVPANPESGSPS
jgi:DNA repair exonuclease SbcCD ATPase subunit